VLDENIRQWFVSINEKLSLVDHVLIVCEEITQDVANSLHWHTYGVHFFLFKQQPAYPYNWDDKFLPRKVCIVLIYLLRTVFKWFENFLNVFFVIIEWERCYFAKNSTQDFCILLGGEIAHTAYWIILVDVLNMNILVELNNAPVIVLNYFDDLIVFTEDLGRNRGLYHILVTHRFKHIPVLTESKLNHLAFQIWQ